MDLQTKKLHFIQDILAISNEELLDKLELLLKNEQKLNPILKEKLTARASKSEEDIKAGRVYDREQAEAKMKERMGSPSPLTALKNLYILLSKNKNFPQQRH